MKSSGIKEPSESPWASPVVLVLKKDGGWRFCIEFRPLNEVTVKDSYPLLWVDEPLDWDAGSGWFSSLDLHSGYWQVPLSADTRLLAFGSAVRELWSMQVCDLALNRECCREDLWNL